MGNLKPYLEAMRLMLRDLRLRSGSNAGIHGYMCLEEFVIRHGREFAWEKGRAPVMGERNQCFMNAAKLSLDEGHVYVEGFAQADPAPIPVQHAWCVGPDGMVLDPTWDEGLLAGAREYVGIPIRREYLIASMLRREVWGVMDDWQGGYPMLADPPALWLDGRVKTGPGSVVVEVERKNKRRRKPCRTGATTR
jgi:hypothetical protein